jgi:hypothetical protein
VTVKGGPLPASQNRGRSRSTKALRIVSAAPRREGAAFRAQPLIPASRGDRLSGASGAVDVGKLHLRLLSRNLEDLNRLGNFPIGVI